MTNQTPIPKSQKYDLEERTAVFGEAVVDFAKRLERSEVSKPLISQIVRSATSVGANYTEADNADSKRDFIHKIGICRREAKETTHWLRMIARANPSEVELCRELWKEAHELVLIFAAIAKSSKSKN